jgi:hypothetical protein
MPPQQVIKISNGLQMIQTVMQGTLRCNALLWHCSQPIIVLLWKVPLPTIMRV